MIRFLFALLILVFLTGCNNKPTGEKTVIASPVSSSEAATMRVLIPLVAKWEGKSNTAYFDLVGVPTICYGHTQTVTKANVRDGRRLSDEECNELLRVELIKYRNGLHKYFSTETKTKRLPSKRDAAFISLAYNVGISGAGKSTATRRLNENDVYGACIAIGWWNKAGGRVIRGLVNRRSEETNLCLDGLT